MHCAVATDCLLCTVSQPKTRSAAKSKLFTGVSKGRRIAEWLRFQIWARGELGKSPVPAWRESSRTSVDSLLGDTFLQFENNSSNRSPFVTVVQSADLR